jgi:ATP-dependent Clp protease protease subunit
MENNEKLPVIIEQGVDWDSRTIYLIGEISDEKSLRIIPIIHLMDASDGPIRIWLSSVGGDELAGYAIFDSLKFCRNTVVIYGFGGIYSIAALIFQAAQVRVLAPNARLMMHNGSICIEGHNGVFDSNALERLAKDSEKNNRRYCQSISDRSGVDLSSLEYWCREERFIDADEAVSLGLADRIFDKKEDSL